MPGRIVPWRLLDRSSDGFIETDFGGRILHANTAAAQLLAGKGAARSGMSLAEYVHADSREAFLPLLMAPHLPDHPREAVVRLLSSHARPVNVLLSVEMEHDNEEMRLWWIIRPAADTDFTRRRLALQAEVSKAFNGMWLDPKELMTIVARSAAELIGDLCVIRIISHDRLTLHPMAIHHCNPEALEIALGVNAIQTQPFGSGPAEIILRTGKSLLIPRVDSRELYSNIGKEFQVYLDAIGVDSLLMVPLRANGEIIGTIGMSRDRGGIPYTAEDQVLLEDLADRAGMAADNVRLHGAVRDELAERSLAEHRYRIVTQATSDVVWDWDLIRGTIWRNSSLTDLLGYEPEELSEFDWWTQWIHPDDRASVVAGLEDAVARAAQTWTSEYRFMRKDGTYAHISDRGCVEVGSDGRAVRMMGAMADVSASREAAAALEASERKYRSLVENIPDILWTADAEGRPSYISPNVEKLLGLTAREVIESVGRESMDIIHPDDLAMVRDAYRALFEENRLYNCEFRVRDANGEWRWIRQHAASTYEVDGCLYADGILSDITDRKDAEYELRIFRSLMDQSNDSIFVIDPEHGRFIDVNDACCVRLGYTRAEMLEMAAVDIETTMSVNLTWEERMRTIRSFGSLTLDGVQRRRDGTTYMVDVNVKLIAVGDREFVVAVARDITERKRVEEELKIFRSLMEQSNDALFVTDPVLGRFLDVNEIAHRRLGYTREQLLLLSVSDIEDSVPGIEEWRNHVESLRNGGSRIVEGRHRRRDGTTYPAEVSIKLITVGDREFVVAVVRDITERKRVEEELKIFRSLMEQSHDSLFVINPASGKILDVNEVAHARLGY
ncbi:MAG: PAS domain S-box protein, partial [Candidatus Kapaibacterium sp.]